MRPLTKEWIQKAEGDLATAHRELRARKAPNFDAACFHAQQSAEKYLKALLQENAFVFGKTHNLSLILDLLHERYPRLELLQPTLAILNAYAVEYRSEGPFLFLLIQRALHLLFKTTTSPFPQFGLIIALPAEPSLIAGSFPPQRLSIDDGWPSRATRQDFDRIVINRYLTEPCRPVGNA
jgi:HEPN domain-containing protein